MLFHQNKEGANMEEGQFDSKSCGRHPKHIEDYIDG
jgi:hypothetical protein